MTISADQWLTHSGGTGGPNYYTGQQFNVGFTNPNKKHFDSDSGEGSAYITINSAQKELFKSTYGDAIWNALHGSGDGTLISETDVGD